jgi:hypothetical protein
MLATIPSKNVKIRIYKTKILSAVLYRYETCSLTSTKEHGLMEFKKRVLRTIFGPKRDEVTGVEESCLMRTLITCI